MRSDCADKLDEAMRRIRDESFSVHTRSTKWSTIFGLPPYCCSLAKQDASLRPILGFGDTPGLAIVDAFSRLPE